MSNPAGVSRIQHLSPLRHHAQMWGRRMRRRRRGKGGLELADWRQIDFFLIRKILIFNGLCSQPRIFLCSPENLSLRFRRN
jgi:hypothetical protein